MAWNDGRLTDVGAGIGNFKTPTLREVARTAPYMHDGTLATLEDVIDFYDGGGRTNNSLVARIAERFQPESRRNALRSPKYR